MEKWLRNENKVQTIEIIVLVQVTILGFLLGEIFYLSQTIGSAFNKYIQYANMQYFANALCVITGIIVCIYFFIRDGYCEFKKYIKSRRYDILLLILLGISISVSVEGVGTSKYQEYINKFDIHQLIFLVGIPVVIAFMIICRAVIPQVKDETSTSFFINDQAIKNKDADLLGFGETASRFAELVMNRNSSDSLVFGINAPWGAGKSSFINFCCECLKNNGDLQPIIVRFEPLRYKESEDLVDKLVNALIDAIKKEEFYPSINSLLSIYLRQLKGKKTFSFFGLSFEFESNSVSIEDTLISLEVHLSALERKIIIIVDDLDRLSWPEVRNILFAIKRSFMLPNISYILCYDIEKLDSLKNQSSEDSEKVKEFLEKFVNVEFSLFIDSKILANFVSLDIDKAINSNSQIEPHSLNQIKLTLKELVKIYESDDFVFYHNYLGDIRKIKRLINSMMLLEISKTDFINSDFNNRDLIHLLLIYINYPTIFRKIYNSETDGKSGFFSLVRDRGDNNKNPKHSAKYREYFDKLNDEQKFLLTNIFDYETVFKNLDYDQNEINEQSYYYSRACFNNSRGNGNLERYLKLIVRRSKQDKLETYQFYINKKKELLLGKQINELFMSDDFSFNKGDFSRNQLWSVLANSAREMNSKTGSDVVTYLIENLPDYSFLEAENVGARSRINLINSLLKFLDEAVWNGGPGHRDNNRQNISEIAEWVFGENGRAGVVNTLSKPERGPLGLFDLLTFRLFCSANRNTGYFNLQKAISLHGDPAAPTEGLVNEITKEEMREISQMVFKVFSQQYIDQKINIFEVIEKLTIKDFAGKTIDFVRTQIKVGKVNENEINKMIAIEKSYVKLFIIFQLGNSVIGNGVGCGFYDEIDKNDKKGIAEKINWYLFEVCFNPEISKVNYERFLDYLLINYVDMIMISNYDDNLHEAISAQITKVLNKELLRKYWLANRETILSLDFCSEENRIFSGKHSASYKEDLKDIYVILDKLTTSTEKSSIPN